MTLAISTWLRGTSSSAPRVDEREKAVQAAETIDALYEALDDTRDCLKLLAQSADRPTRDVLSNRIGVISTALTKAEER